MQDNLALADDALAVLKGNDRGSYTQPGAKLYPHQWLWDSCFIAIGLRHINPKRAEVELKSLLRGQWHNGMLPNIIFSNEAKYKLDRDHWRSWLSPVAPLHVATSGYTQPPMLAEAIVRVGQKLNKTDRLDWFKAMYPGLVNYHQWLYKERDPRGEGLILLIHPCESGLDNTPPWMSQLHDHLMPLWVKAIEALGIDNVINLLRSDLKAVPSDQRILTSEALAIYSAELRLRHKRYDIERILDKPLMSIEDLNFNSILIRANRLLLDIAKTINQEVSKDLIYHMHKTEAALEQLYDPSSGQYYSRDFITHRLLKIPSIATLLPLYSGSISQSKARHLVKLLKDRAVFNTNYPVPSVPIRSNWFDEKRYWQGPTWLNTNWLIIDGLSRYGFNEEAATLKLNTLNMVKAKGFYEYFNPKTGQGLGSSDFSWTAALTLDLLNS